MEAKSYENVKYIEKLYTNLYDETHTQKEKKKDSYK